jgi:pyruvate/2-oxoglutarate dehydrogenase complex dihydrolipoamide dehydrogenase (E3) component
MNRAAAISPQANIFVNTGKYPSSTKDRPGAEFDTGSDGNLDIMALPRQVAKAGAGHYSVEVARALNSLGVETNMPIRRETVLESLD